MSCSYQSLENIPYMEGYRYQRNQPHNPPVNSLQLTPQGSDLNITRLAVENYYFQNKNPNDRSPSYVGFPYFEYTRPDPSGYSQFVQLK
jgi:hypothetical protein